LLVKLPSITAEKCHVSVGQNHVNVTLFCGNTGKFFFKRPSSIYLLNWKCKFKSRLLYRSFIYPFLIRLFDCYYTYHPFKISSHIPFKCMKNINDFYGFFNFLKKFYFFLIWFVDKVKNSMSDLQGKLLNIKNLFGLKLMLTN
jgi:hypothetical protein